MLALIKITFTKGFSMQIGQLAQTDNVYQTLAKNTSGAMSGTVSAKNEQVEISSAGKNAQAKWQDIASKYNVNNISTNERVEMAAQLRENNLISSEQHMKLVAPSSMNDDFTTKANYLADVQGSSEVAQGSPAALKLLSILEHLNELS